MCVIVYHCVGHGLYQCVYVFSVFNCVPACVGVTLCVFGVCLSLWVCGCVSVCFSMCVYVSVSNCVCQCVCVCQSVLVCLCPSVCVFQ